MKVFTNNMMPDSIRNEVLNSTNGQYSNSVFIRWYMEDDMPVRSLCKSDEEYEEDVEYFERNQKSAWTVTQWLLAQGCNIGDYDVLVEHSW